MSDISLIKEVQKENFVEREVEEEILTTEENSINVTEENVETIDQTIISGDNVIVVKTDNLTFVTSTFQDEKIQEKFISESKFFSMWQM